MKDDKRQRWILKKINENSDIFTIQSADVSGNVMDCENGSRSNGTNVIQWKSNEQKNQKWKILPAWMIFAGLKFIFILFSLDQW